MNVDDLADRIVNAAKDGTECLVSHEEMWWLRQRFGDGRDEAGYATWIGTLSFPWGAEVRLVVR